MDPLEAYRKKSLEVAEKVRAQPEVLQRLEDYLTPRRPSHEADFKGNMNETTLFGELESGLWLAVRELYIGNYVVSRSRWDDRAEQILGIYDGFAQNAAKRIGEGQRAPMFSIALRKGNHTALLVEDLTEGKKRSIRGNPETYIDHTAPHGYFDDGTPVWFDLDSDYHIELIGKGEYKPSEPTLLTEELQIKFE